MSVLKLKKSSIRNTFIPLNIFVIRLSNNGIRSELHFTAPPHAKTRPKFYSECKLQIIISVRYVAYDIYSDIFVLSVFLYRNYRNLSDKYT